MKRVLILTISMFMICLPCFAMSFSQPVEIGKVSDSPMGIITVSDAEEHSGTPFTNMEYVKSYHIDEQNRKGAHIYDKGIARFGTGEEAIYFHYDARNGRRSYKDGYNAILRFGAKDISNTLQVGIAIPTTIHVIGTDSGLYIYLLVNGDPSGLTGTTHTVLGKRADGTFVKYFDTRELKKKSFSQPREFKFSETIVDGDTITFVYQWRNPDMRDYVDAGEFRFKWDDDAQWFGVEQVVY